jgi:hypothetical protein
MKKISLVIFGITTLIIGAVFVFIISKRDPYICSNQEIEQLTKKLDVIIEDWNDANSLASSSSRIALAIPVNNLQTIQKEVRNLEVSECAQPVIDNFLNITQNTIDGYLLFMQKKNESTIAEKFSESKESERLFVTYYSRFKDGKSINPLEVSKEIVEDSQKILENVEEDPE